MRGIRKHGRALGFRPALPTNLPARNAFSGARLRCPGPDILPAWASHRSASNDHTIRFWARECPGDAASVFPPGSVSQASAGSEGDSLSFPALGVRCRCGRGRGMVGALPVS